MNDETEGGRRELIMVGSRLGSTRWELKTAEVHCPFIQPDVDGFCGSPLPVSTHTCLHLGTVPVDGMLGLVGMNWYAILCLPPFHCMFVLANPYF